MTVLRLIGYWLGPTEPGWPDVRDFVVADPDPVEQRAVAAYLRSGTAFVAAGGISMCRVCGDGNGSAEQTDGTHFVWPEGLAHYVEAHDVRLPDDVVTVAMRGPAPAVDAGRFLRTTTTDPQWWLGLASEPDGRPLVWPDGSHLPATADIVVDRVPADGLAMLVQIRRLLEMAWPFADLRPMLARQPFLAVPAGDPAALYRRLLASPLRPYLFYRADTGLLPVRAP